MLFYNGALAHSPSCEIRPSYFSDEYEGGDLKGFMNLGILLMFANNFMLILDNFLQYGFILKNNVNIPLEIDRDVSNHSSSSF